MMANVLLARCALPTGPAWGVLADDRIEIVATDAGTNGGFLASLLQLQRPVRALLERRRGALTLKAAEVLAAGVTYERSRVARMEETAGAETFYDKVYTAERPELFFKGAASRVSGHNGPIRIRRDSSWNVPEPEIAVLVSAHGEIAGYTVGNDVSSRDIEGDNPLYLPQAKIYRESCALGPVVWLTDEDKAPVFDIAITIQRRGTVAWEGKISTASMRRSFSDLAEWLVRDNVFPSGAYLLTGTGLVPEAGFTLAPEDRVSITVPRIGTLSNHVVQG